MLKKTISYEDFNGNMVSEDFYFNLTKAELVELELSEKKGLAETLKEIVASNDGALIVEKFKYIILLAYGKKSEDGRRFIKSQELREEFQQTPAYSELFIELATNAEAAANFVKGIVPQTGMAPDALDLVAQPYTTPSVAPEAPVRPVEAPVAPAPILPHPAPKKTREELLAELEALDKGSE